MKCSGREISAVQGESNFALSSSPSGGSMFIA
jgi:hypothetical protein